MRAEGGGSEDEQVKPKKATGLLSSLFGMGRDASPEASPKGQTPEEEMARLFEMALEAKTATMEELAKRTERLEMKEVRAYDENDENRDIDDVCTLWYDPYRLLGGKPCRRITRLNSVTDVLQVRMSSPERHPLLSCLQKLSRWQCRLSGAMLHSTVICLHAHTRAQQHAYITAPMSFINNRSLRA